MRRLFLLLLAGSFQGSAIEGTVWYDSKGKVAWVDGPAAVKKAPVPFVPQWIAREERRDRALRGDHRPRRSNFCEWPAWGVWSGGRTFYQGAGGFPACRSFPSSFQFARPSGGVRVIIR